MGASEIYERAATQFARLELEDVSHREWIRFSHDVLEALMRCQAIVMEKQRRVLELRSIAGAADDPVLRTEAKDALAFVERLTELYQRIKGKLDR